MSDLPESLNYAETHEWVKLIDDGVVEIGITDHAQEELGDLVFVQLPDIGRRVTAGEACAVVESVKTASDLHSPVAGEVVASNDSLRESPEAINDKPYKTWIFRIKPDAAFDASGLLDATGYNAMIG